MTDEHGRIQRINPAALSILGYNEKELLGKWYPKAIVSLSDGGAPVGLIDRPISRAFITGNTISEKMTFQRKDGRMVHVSVTVSPMMIDNRPIGAIEVFRDISLEHEIDRMKSEFISLASHQLRTPLSAIKTYTHMLLDGFMGPVDPTHRKALRTIISASDHMNQLINTLLNITRIESGNITITPKTTNLSKLASEVHKELEHSAAEKKIDLELTLPRTSILVRTDALITKEILTNIVTNAIKYTSKKGKVHIVLRPRQQVMVFSVTDTGLGIPAFSQNQVFTKFFRAHNVIKMEASGTGLGLYLVKGLTEALGGKVWFKSEENVGSTFYFSIPRTKPKAKAKAKPEK